MCVFNVCSMCVQCVFDVCSMCVRSAFEVNICMCARICLCMHAHLHVLPFSHPGVRLCGCVSVCRFLSVSASVGLCVYMCQRMRTHECMCERVRVCLNVGLSESVYACMRVCICMQVRTHNCAHVLAFMYARDVSVNGMTA